MLPSLLRAHGPKLHALAMRLCGNAADAQDMLQETFLQAQRKWHTFRGESDPGTWIYAIAARMCKRRMRQKFGTNRAMPALSQVAPWTETTVSRAGLRLEGPFATLERKEAEESLHVAIAALPEHFRVPLILKEILELPLAEVAEALGIRSETAKTRVHRARLLLRKALMRELPQRIAPAPIYEKRLCLDLLNAKLAAMDKGRGFPIGQEVVCARCRAVFRELDLVQDTCARMAKGSLPAEVRTAIQEAIRAVDSSSAAKGRTKPLPARRGPARSANSRRSRSAV